MQKLKLFFLVNLLLTSAGLNAFGPDDPLDVAVVGGGLAGLSTALKLKSQTNKFMVFEGRNRLGGRAWTQTIDGKPADCGAEFVEKKDNALRELIKKYKIATSPARLQDEVFFIEGDHKRSVSEMLPVLESLYNKLSTAHSSLKRSDYVKLSNNNWVARSLFKVLDLTDAEKALFNAVVRDETGRDAAELPASALKEWINDIQNYLKLAQAKATKQDGFLKSYHDQYRIDGGTKVLVDAMANEIGSDKIQKGNPITQVSWDLSTALYKIRFQDRSKHYAKSVAMTIPFSVLKGSSLLDDRSLGITPDMRGFIDDMPYGTNSKVVVPVGGNLRLTYGIDLQGRTAWASNTGELHVILGGTEGANVDQTSANLLANRFLKHSGKALPPGSSPVVINWLKDPFSKGSYCASLSGTSFSELDEQSKEHPELTRMATALSSRGFFFAGEHLCYPQTGHMNSAVRTGKAVASLILKFLKK